MGSEHTAKGLKNLIMTQMNKEGAFTSYLGIRISQVGALTAEGTVVSLSVHANPMGTIHGGLLFTLMDAVGGAAGASAGRGCSTIDASVQFLRSAVPGETLTCRAECVKEGTNIIVMRMTVSDPKGRALATGTFVYYRTKEICKYSKD